MRYIFTNPYKSLCSVEDGATSAGGESKTTTLTNAIEQAVSDVNKQIPIQEEETKVEKKEEKEEKKEEKKEVDELDETQLGYAKVLYKALNNSDPNVQKQALKALAAAAGLDLKEVETKKEAAEATETLLDLLKNGLGEYDFLADKLAPVLEKALNKAIEAQTKDIRDSIKESREERLKAEINQGIDAAFGEFENALEVKDEVSKLMDQMRPAKGISHKDYFRSLIIVAASNKNVTLRKQGQKTEADKSKIEKNRNDAASRLASERGAEVKLGVKTPSKMSLNDAVKEAVASLASGKE